MKIKNLFLTKNIKFTLLLGFIICILILGNSAKKEQFVADVYCDANEYITECDLEDSEPANKYTPKEVLNKRIEKLKLSMFKNVKISNENRKFIEGLMRVALEEQERFGIPASIKIAQAILESGWGRDGLAKTYNNYFGIKHKNFYTAAEKKLVGIPISVMTHEYNKARKKYYKKDNFISYETRWASIRHHSLFLKERIDNGQNNAYIKLRKVKVQDYKRWAKYLQKTGYATSPYYSSKLIFLIEYYNLDRITHLSSK